MTNNIKFTVNDSFSLKHKEVIIEIGNTKIDLGLLDKEETEHLAKLFLCAVLQLHSISDEPQKDWLQKILDRCYLYSEN